MVRVGIDTRIFKHLNIDMAISKISKLFNIIEVCASHVKKLERECITIRDVANILSRLKKEYNVDIVQIHAPYGDIDGLLTDPNERENATSRILAYIELCYLTECPILVMHVPYREPKYGEKYLDFIKNLEEATRYVVRRLDKYLRDFNVKIAFENRLERCFGCIPDDIVKIISEEGVENFGICLDTGHANVNKLDIGDVLRRFHNYIIATHVHDNDGLQDRHMPPLMGSIDWKTFIENFKRYCSNIPIILEVEPLSDRCSDNTLELCYMISKKLFE